MCGIVGAINGSKVVDNLLTGLKQLEYRGYDSAGIGLVLDGNIECRKATGELENLESILALDPVDARVGISHTRWATHGTATLENTHPHENGDVCVVHNGIVENYFSLRQELEAKGHIFTSDTDSEVIPHLISDFLQQGHSHVSATQQALGQLEGAYAVNVVFKGMEDVMLAGRNVSPLLIGHGEDANYAASDALAIADMANEISYLEDGDLGIITQHDVQIIDKSGDKVERHKEETTVIKQAVDKKEFDYHMEKEIHEQPEVVEKILKKYCHLKDGHVKDQFATLDLANIDRLLIIACGTSYYAGQVAKYWFERYANLPVDIDIASEFRYREAPMRPNGAALFISQSGETADTLAALKYAKSCDQKIISLVNVPDSSIARESDVVIETHAGPEIGVASTKAFMAQLTCLGLLAVKAGWERGMLSSEEEKEIVQGLYKLPEILDEELKKKGKYQAIAKTLKHKPSAVFIGRGVNFPLAMEGALKLKEISYIHAEGFGAGELKHGPIALISEDMPVIAIAPDDALFEKMHSNVKEIQARGGQIILISDKKKKAFEDIELEHHVTTQECHTFLKPFVMTLPLQLISFYTALAKGTNIDKPRNLAKSVTVE